jgi:hypothetical protein
MTASQGFHAFLVALPGDRSTEDSPHEPTSPGSHRGYGRQLRLNRAHPTTIFRVRVDGLEPGTTYYYTIDSMRPNGTSDGLKSPVSQFATLKQGATN